MSDYEYALTTLAAIGGEHFATYAAVGKFTPRQAAAAFRAMQGANVPYRIHDFKLTRFPQLWNLTDDELQSIWPLVPAEYRATLSTQRELKWAA